MARAQVGVLLLSLFLLGACEDKKDSNVNFRLPETFTPIHYDLTIITDVKEPNFKFTGKVIIHMACINDTPDLVIHMKELNISFEGVRIKSGNATGNGTKAKAQKYDEKLDMLTLTFDQPFVAKQEYTVEIPYFGVVRDDMVGFYRSSYKIPETNATKWLAATQFEPIDARRAFPCFDEPALKATFTISLGHPTELTAISNMPVDKSEPMPDKTGWVLDTFKESLKMSTYLVCFIISDFVSKDTKGSVPFRTFTHKDQISQVELAASSAPKILSFYEEYFGIKYPMPKLDIAALPDFNTGAMENYGLITFRESMLFVDKARSPTDDEYYTIVVVAHEISHHWFGDLVTMKWWTDMWLNEGFANYMASVATAQYIEAKGEWYVLREDLVTNARWVYPEDALSTSHPIQAKINNPTEIDELFDNITYRKGSYLIHMLTMFLTQQVFQKGLTAYLTKFSYSNAESKDLWDALSEAGHQAKILPDNLSVNTIMESWITKAGFPLLNVKREGSTLEFTQTRFLSDAKGSSESAAWWIPLLFVGSTPDADIFNSSKPVWLPADSKGLGSAGGKDIITGGKYELTGVKDTDWFLVGKEMSVMMRVNYDDKNWDSIIAQLKADHTKIPVMNRVQLIMDVDEFAKYNIMTYDRAFQLISYITKDESILPWRVTLYFLQVLRDRLVRTKAIDDYQAFAMKLYADKYKKVAATKPSRDHYGLRYQAWRFHETAYRLEIPELEEKAKAEFAAYKKNPDTYVIDPDFEEVAFRAGVRSGTKDDFDFVKDRYTKSKYSAEKENLMKALTNTKDMALLNALLEESYSSKSVIKKQDLRSLIQWTSENPFAFQTGKDFLIKNADKIFTFFGDATSDFAKHLSYFCPLVTSEAEMKEIADFIEKNQKYVKDATITIQKCQTLMKVNVQWQTDNYQEVAEFLAKNKA